MEHPYPVNLDVHGRRAVVIGGGAVAARKIGTLLHAGAVVTVISPTLDPRVDRRHVQWVPRRYAPGDFDSRDIYMVIACTDDAAVNAQAVRDAQAAGVPLVNNTGDPAQSSFYNVAVIEHDDLMVTVSTNGHAPGRARRVKQQLREWLAGERWLQ